MSKAKSLQHVHTLIIGSGAAGLCSAVRLRAEGVHDILIATEGLDQGTSINTGSDKQTYYKMSLCGQEHDSPYETAQTLFNGGAMHGDIALVEAALSVRAFMHLVNLGVQFPTDSFGQFVGYKTDHDPRQRATSVGPYTSRDMCLALIDRIHELQVPVNSGWRCVQLLSANHICLGAVFQTSQGDRIPVLAENTIFAVGGPGNLYANCVYPESQTGSIGLALEIGAETQNVQHSQFGLASTKFRWNVSGTYMQVIPRFVSTDQNGNDPQEFLLDRSVTNQLCDSLKTAPTKFNHLAHSPFSSAVLYSMVFLKGYQWPFDVEKISPHAKDLDQHQDTVNDKLYSSEIDLLVYQETVIKNRRVFLDYRVNPTHFDFTELATEAYQYLAKSEALLGTPLERLDKMNPSAIQLYAEHGIDLRNEMLEIAVCAQHNNGGLAGTIWYESTNIKNLFPVGEVNGSHGITRPGGSALNAGQVGAFRAAEYIANKNTNKKKVFSPPIPNIAKPICSCSATAMESIRASMSRYGGVIRNTAELSAATFAAWNLYRDEQSQYALTHAVYLDAIRYSAEAGRGCRGALVLKDGKVIRNKEQDEKQDQNAVLVSRYDPATQRIEHRFEQRRPIPDNPLWFETAWQAFQNGEIY